jgi:hypothetical protein
MVAENLLFFVSKAKNGETLSTCFDNLDTDIATQAAQTEECEEEMSAGVGLQQDDDGDPGRVHESRPGQALGLTSFAVDGHKP